MTKTLLKMQGFSISSPSSLAVIDCGKLNMGEFYNLIRMEIMESLELLFTKK